MVQKTNLSKYKNVFCDSLEALEYAYQQGLSRNAIIRTSSPAMLWNKNQNITHVESHWNVDLMKEFQSTIKGFSEEIYDNVMPVEGISREESLCVAQVAVSFQRLLFKASCLTKRDLVEPRLIINVDGWMVSMCKSYYALKIVIGVSRMEIRIFLAPSRYLFFAKTNFSKFSYGGPYTAICH